MPKRRACLIGLIGLALGVSVWGLLAATRSASAAPPAQAGTSNEYCLECHSKPGQILTLPSGEELYITIDAEGFTGSVHGQVGYACVQCHTGIREYPHPAFDAQDRRDATLQLYLTCKQCHSGEYERTLDSVHEAALRSGNKNAAVCSDCHNPHYQTRITDPATGVLERDKITFIPQTCARCHSGIYDQYKYSVHGSALLGGGNRDVPTCIDCHGVHNIPDPTTSRFRVSSPELCARCHTDPELMGKYGISTAVLNTYVADFHGTTVTLFERQSPDDATNKPVCTDCHGIHDIKRADDPSKGLHVKANLLTTCQKCHPDATTNFPDSWLSHYIPAPDRHSLVYYVNVFYRFFIPGVLGGMGVFVAADAGRRIVRRIRREGHS